MTQTPDDESPAALPCYVVAVSWLNANLNVPLGNGALLAGCKGCPPRVAALAAAPLYAQTAPVTAPTSPKCVLLIQFQTPGDAVSWATNYGAMFELVYGLP
jgi:hypothetical protein